ncbi:MAG: hypothetical protein U9O94_11495 [Nanoarchaeota archaeon]|nr:hypothetical protein [Nanoarchaeota archaeon]
MKRKTFFIISLIYSILLLLISIATFADFFLVDRVDTLIRALFILPVSIGMLLGSIGIKYKKSFAKYLLIITGILSLPLGLIITYFAFKEDKLEK